MSNLKFNDWLGIKKGLSPQEKLNQGIGMGLSAVNLIGNVAGNLSSNKKELDELQTEDVAAGSKLELANLIGGYTPIKLNRENEGLSALSGATSGASAGAGLGPLGMAGGAVIGGITSLIGASSRNRQAKRTEDRLYTEQMNKFQATNEKLSEQGISNALTNYAAYGGNLFRNGGEFTNNITEFNIGGTHEANINGGIPQGIGANGKPNLVEEGEVKFDNYIFSNRLYPDANYLQTLGLPNKYTNKTFAKSAKLISKESKERPNDPISRNTQEAMLNRLSNVQEIQRGTDIYDNTINAQAKNLGIQDKVYAKGGQLFTSNNLFEVGGKKTSRGSMRTMIDVLQAAKVPGSGMISGIYDLFANTNINYGPTGMIRISPKREDTVGNALAAARADIMSSNNSTPSTTASPNTNTPQSGTGVFKGNPTGPSKKENAFQRTPLNPVPAMSNNINFNGVQSDYLNPNNTMKKAYESFVTTNQNNNMNPQTRANTYSDIGMLAPALGNLSTLLGAVGSSAETISIPRIKAGERLRTDLPYEAMDVNFPLAKLSAQAGGTRRSLMDMAGGNRGAATTGLLASDTGYLGAIGDTYTQARNYNKSQIMQNIQLANQARQANSAAFMQEQAYNQQAATTEWDINARNRAARRSAIQQGISALAQNLGDFSRYSKNTRTVSNMFPMFNTEGEFNI